MHRHSATLSRHNVKQEICNSYHLEGTFDPVVSHWPGYPLQSGPAPLRWRTVSPGKGIYCACEWDNRKDRRGLTLTVDPCRRRRLYVRYVTRVREEIYADQEL